MKTYKKMRDQMEALTETESNRKDMTLKYPKSARHGLRFLLGKVYTEKFFLLHRKSDTKAKTGEDLKVAVVENKLKAFRGQ